MGRLFSRFIYLKSRPGKYRYINDAMLILVTLIWGATFTMVKIALDDIGVFGFLALRFTIASVAITVFIFPKLKDLDIKTLASGVILGIFLFASYALQTMGLFYTSVSNVGFITGLNVAWVPILSILILYKKPSGWAILGVIFACVGLFLLVTKGKPIQPNLGEMWTLGCSFAIAFHLLFTGIYAPKMNPDLLAGIQITTVALLSWLSWPIWEDISFVISTWVWGAAIFTALFATVFAFVCQTRVQRIISPTRTAIIFTTEPVFCALFAYWYIGETMGTIALIGAGMILLGMLCAEIKPKEWS